MHRSAFSSALALALVLGVAGICGCGPDPGPEPEPVATPIASPPLRSPPSPGADELLPAEPPREEASQQGLARPRLSAHVMSELAPHDGCPSLPACVRVEGQIYDQAGP